MSTRDELAELLDRIYYDYEGGYLSNEENLEFVQADALIAEGWRKKPSREEMARAIFDLQYHSMHWLDAQEPEKDDYRNRADQILALMDRGQ